MTKIRFILSVIGLIACLRAYCQAPTISPLFFQHSDLITVSYDVTGTSLAGLSEAFIWVWIPGPNLNSRYNINPASSNPGVTNVPGPNGPKFTKTFPDGKTVFTITFRPSDFFTQPITSYTQLGMLLKGNDWSFGQTTDHVASFWDGSYQVQLTAPSFQPLFVTNGQTVSVVAEASEPSDFILYKNGVPIHSEDGINVYTHDVVVSEFSGGADFLLEATNGVSLKQLDFQYLISGSSPIQARPSGVIAGINYHPGDPTRVTLCLWAPGKNSVYAFGDFSDWKVQPSYVMNRDGEFFWIELTGLIAGKEYAFQYLVNQTIKVADPYADKILDPDDQYIPNSTYPGLQPFPQDARNSQWYFNRLSVFQTGQAPYNWQTTGYQRPPKEELIIYEVLLRDFFDENSHTYQSLIDTLSYLKHFGINAVQLMPVMEFNGNESWGYNPAFMFAPDKYYGTKNKFKEFIDLAHGEGIAVILDIALNHQDIPNTYAMLDFNFSTFKPTSNNRWFNVDATHPFNVFFDMNHESAYTQAYVDTVCHYWLNEFKIDGFRFDLSKGFTQKFTGSDVGAWSAYDASRVALLKRMADKIWQHTPDAYIILEHFAENNEERELAQYRSGEGKGMLIWGKMTDPYNQCTMGYTSNSDFSGVYHTARGWSVPHLVGYMESHDEERIMYKNLQFGRMVADYNVKELSTALYRMRSAAAVFYTIPGPKMLWQFGELGYDHSINECEDGTVNEDCRLSEKPVRWNYLDDPDRKKLHDHISDLLRLRKQYKVFRSGTASFQVSTSSLAKQVILRNSPYTESPATADEMNVLIAVNFDVTAQEVQLSFPHGGTWYEYYAYGKPVDVSGSNLTVTLYPGEYKLFTDVEITNPLITGIEPESSKRSTISVYPNPSSDFLKVAAEQRVTEVKLISVNGISQKLQRVDESTWDLRNIQSGFYVLVVRFGNSVRRFKLIKE
ncbi:alpha-amylase family glycosyl hydrolase [Oscillatoria amoena NRMC-F 0135]|nr:alpha-amylase family glycosyl hydrolase [Oscillatoria amoena NRMC-F 0135]